MPDESPAPGPAEAGLWQAVTHLWSLAGRGDLAAIDALLHPDYTGWVTGEAHPHDRVAALAAVGPEAPATLDWTLEPLVLRVVEDRVGIAHYRYRARVRPAGAAVAEVTGLWAEVHLRDGGRWRLVAVSGGPDGAR
jgi:ketosteroid isomerase-like protein